MLCGWRGYSRRETTVKRDLILAETPPIIEFSWVCTFFLSPSILIGGSNMRGTVDSI
jgi:hypothetical protein